MMKNFKKKLFKIILYTTILFFSSTLLVTILYKFIPVPLTPLMIIRFFEHDKKVFEKDWVSITEINPELPLAVIASEDQLFLQHYGFDVNAIQKAVKYNNKKKGKKVKGASTISQQTAKNVFLWSGRSWLRKGFEVYFTALIELLWSKERIMEVYLNVIEMGNGIYGAEAAAHYYFNKSAARLTSAECAAIAAILPNPLKWNASKRTAYIEKRKNWILRQMQHLRGGLVDSLFDEEEPEELNSTKQIK